MSIVTTHDIYVSIVLLHSCSWNETIKYLGNNIVKARREGIVKSEADAESLSIWPDPEVWGAVLFNSLYRQVDLLLRNSLHLHQSFYMNFKLKRHWVHDYNLHRVQNVFGKVVSEPEPTRNKFQSFV